MRGEALWAQQGGETYDMTGQLGESAKATAMARGVSRRRALRGLLGGVAGAVVASLMAGSKAPPAEAGIAETTPAASQAGPSWDQRHPGASQRPDVDDAGLNQRRPRRNQARLNQATLSHARLNAMRATADQARGNRWPSRGNRSRSVSNQQGPWLNHHLPTSPQGAGPTLNMVHGPNFNQPTRP